MKNEAKVTIGRRNLGDDEVVAISIKDSASGLVVVEIEISLESFASAVTGLSFCPAEYRFKPTQFTVDNICKNREVKRISLTKPDTFDRDDRKANIARQIEESGELVDGWMLFDDGCGSQQNEKYHKATLYIFVDERTDR